MNKALQQLEAIFDPGTILTGDEASNHSSGNWGPAGGLKAKAIVRPKTTAEVSAALRICHEGNQSVVVHGGLTGVVGATATTENDIVVSLERMNRIEEIDEVSRTMTVQSGVVLQTLQEEAEKVDLMFPLDLGARGSCMIGGNVATNAGGNRVLRYGMTRDMVLGVEAVLADGTVVSSLNKMIKNNAGYDLKHLFIGSEGTLGIVTRVVLRLLPLPMSQNNAFVALQTFDKVLAFLKFVEKTLGGSLSAFEVLWKDFYELVTTEPAQSKPPLSYDHPYYALIESLGANQEEDATRFQKALERASKEGLIENAVVAQSRTERDALWAMRDDVQQVWRYDPVFLFDVSLAVKEMSNYVPRVQGELTQAWPEHRCFTFGHLGDGNLHFLISAGCDDEETRNKVEQIVYEPLVELGGSVSAEHGIGLEKKDYLSWCRTESEIALMRTLKRALDPKGILNPGKIFD